MSETSSNETITNVENPQKRRPGRPRTGFNKKEYNKKVLEEKGDSYEKVKNNIYEYNKRCKNAYQLLKELRSNDKVVIPEEYKEKLELIFGKLNK